MNGFFDYETLPPEIEEGNVEYKLKLINPSKLRLEQLITQLKWRLREGNGEALYELGVEDHGFFIGLSKHDLERSKATLQKMADKLGASLQILREKVVVPPCGVTPSTSTDILMDSRSIIPTNNFSSLASSFNGGNHDKAGKEKYVCEILVRMVSDDQPFIDIRLAVLGNHNSGKSTLIGVLTRGELDDGVGRARLSLFRHAHEVESGRTSCISIDILGFNSEGQLINYENNRTVEEIYETSTKLITFLDLAGFYKYQKTTLFGLTNYSPDYVMLLIDSTTGLVGTSKEHLGLALALNMPLFILLSKTDQNNEHCDSFQAQLTQTANDNIIMNHNDKNIGDNHSNTPRAVHKLKDVYKALENMNKIPFLMTDVNQVHTAAYNMPLGNVVPILEISCVSGHNLDLLKQFLQRLPAKIHGYKTVPKQSLSTVPLINGDLSNQHLITSRGQLNSKGVDGKKRKTGSEEGFNNGHTYNTLDSPQDNTLTEFLIDEVFTVDGVSGCVVSGILDAGVAEEGQTVLVGPFENASSVRINDSQKGDGLSDATFKSCIITSIRRYNRIRRSLKRGDCATVALKIVDPFSDYSIDSTAQCNIKNQQLSLFASHKMQHSHANNSNNNHNNYDKDLSPQNSITSTPVDGQNDFKDSEISPLLSLRKGMVLLHPNLNPIPTIKFEAQIHVLYHPTCITSGYQTSVFVRNIRQTAVIESIVTNQLRTGQSGTVVFRFLRHPEYLKLGSKLILREASMRAIGHITNLFLVT